MGLFDFWKKRGQDVDLEELSSSTALKKKQPLRVQLRNYSFRVQASLKVWKTAVIMAEDEQRPRRYELYLLYKVIMEDEEVLTQVRTARMNVQMAPFVLCDDKGKEVKDARKLLEQPWFFKYLEYCVDTEMWGNSLIQFFTDATGEIDRIELVPRLNVRPEPQDGEIVIQYGDETGIPYRSGPLQRYVMEIGDKYDLGLLKTVSKLSIRKGFNMIDWGRRNERFGMPFLVIKTASANDEEINKKQDMAENFGANNYMILDTDDEFEFKEAMSQTGGGHKSFQDFIEMLDSKIQKLINGQTGTSDEKAFVGSAEVHERQLNKYTLARLLRIQYHINDELFPWLAKYYGMGQLSNLKFCFTDLMEEAQESKEDPKIEDVDPEDEPSKKKA